MKRVFIAMNLPENIKRIVLGLVAELQKNYRRAPLRFVKPDGLHLTLHFLGEQDKESIQKIMEIMEEIVSPYKKVKLRLGRLGFFPNKFRPRVLWVSTEEIRDQTIENLQKELGRKLEKFNITIDSRPWHPHITLGRIKGPIETKLIQNIKIPFAEWEVCLIELIESFLKPEGPEYKIIHRTKLKAKA